MPNTYLSRNLIWGYPFSKIQAVLSHKYVRTTFMADRTSKVRKFKFSTKIGQTWYIRGDQDHLVVEI
jgi:hypothetical protein